MSSLQSASVSTSGELDNRKIRISLWIAGVLFAFFGVLTIHYGYSLIVGQRPWAAVFVYLISGYTLNIPEPGMISSKANFMGYREMLANMSTHMIVGGLVVMFGLLQFVPRFRRSNPKLHRVSGTVLGISMILVCITSLYFLTNTAPNEVLAGVPFWFILMELTLMPLFFISQAILAIKQKAFRDHMVWMGLTFACFLTAPLLRFNYALTGQLEEQVINRLVLNSSPSIFLQTFILFGLWLIFVGEKDLPSLQKTASQWIPVGPLGWLKTTSIIGLIMVMIFGYSALVPIFELQTNWLFVLGGLMGTAKCIQVSQSGQTPSRSYAAATGLFSASMIGLAMFINTDGYYAHALVHCLMHLAAIELLTLGLALKIGPLSSGRNLFGLFSAGLTWSWAGVALLTALMTLTGYSADISLVTALAVAPAIFVGLCVAYAAGVSVRFSFSTKKV